MSDRLKELLSDIESLWVGAGETCPEDYQNAFDWKEYTEVLKMINNRVKSYGEDLEKLLNKITVLSHEGGLRGLSISDALNEIRKLTKTKYAKLSTLDKETIKVVEEEVNDKCPSCSGTGYRRNGPKVDKNNPNLYGIIEEDK